MSVMCAPDPGRVQTRNMIEHSKNTLFVKGAAECMIERCSHAMLDSGSVVPLDDDMRKRFLASVERMADRALRCLALAQKVTHCLTF